LLETFQRFLLDQFAERKRVLLIIDEAQNLPINTIEEIRMLSNLEGEKEHLIQMVLSGQPEMQQTLKRKELQQFTQRVTVHSHLDSLSEEETDEYVRHRLRVAGAVRSNIFEREAIKAVFKYSGGIPRMINIICDTALVYGYADDSATIGRADIEEVVKSRKIGIPPDETAKADTVPLSSPPRQISSPETMEDRLQTLEQRIHRLEIGMINRYKELYADRNKLEERDRIILDLLKIIMQNMKGRSALVKKYIRLRKEMEKGLG